MNTKNTVILLIIAAVLLAAAWWYSKREESITREAQAPVRQVISGVTSSTIQRIEIKTPETTNPVVLTNRDGVWYTDVAKKYEADKTLVSGLFAAIEKDIDGEVVSMNPDNFGEYNVNATSATHVRLFGTSEKPVEDLYIGKAGPSFTSTFVRKEGENEVINANASLGYAFTKPEGWRNKTILETKPESIVAIDSQGTSGTFAVAKVGDIWKMEKPNTRDAQMSKLQPMTGALTSLRATDFAERSTTQPLSDFGLDPPKQKISVTIGRTDNEPTKTVVLLLGDPRDNGRQYYIKRLDREFIYVVPEYIAKNLTPSPSELSPEPQAAPTSASVSAKAPATSGTAASKMTTGTSETIPPKAVTPAVKQTTETKTAAAAPQTTASATPVPKPPVTPKPTVSVTTATSAAPAAPVSTKAPVSEATPTKKAAGIMITDTTVTAGARSNP